MGVDWLAVNHERKEYLRLNRPMRSGGISVDETEILLYKWAGEPVVFLSDSGSEQETYHAITTGDVQTWGHAYSHGPGACLCDTYKEIKP